MIIVGEKINASIPSVKEAIGRKDAAFLADLARSQDEAGAHFIDVNAGDGREGGSSPVDTMKWLVELVQDVTDKPLCIDSDSPAVLESGLEAYRGGEVLINSISAEEDRLDRVGRIVAANSGARVVALVMKDSGIPQTVEERLAAAAVIVESLAGRGVSEDRILFDPLVLPVSVDSKQAKVTLKTIETIKERYPAAGTIMGLSNISFGLPARGIVNRTFLIMAAEAGLDAAILNPLDKRLMSLVITANLLTDRDPRCKRFIRAFRRGELTE